MLFFFGEEVPAYLLDRGADIDSVDYRGWTALHMAAFCANIRIVRLLMSYGANLYVKNNDGRLPIDLAATEEIKQAIRDEEARRDHRYKRIPAADLLPHCISSQEGGDDDDDEEDESSREDVDEDGSHKTRQEACNR